MLPFKAPINDILDSYIFAAGVDGLPDWDGALAKLDDYADIIRMLNTQRALALGGRAMCHIALAEQIQGASQTLMDMLTSELHFRAAWPRMAPAAEGSAVASHYGTLYRHVRARPWPAISSERTTT